MKRLAVSFSKVDGSVTFIYDDKLRCLLSEDGDSVSPESAEIRRASHVEPTADGRWTADMSPVSGPVLGPFDERGQALQAEVDWLITHGVPFPETANS